VNCTCRNHAIRWHGKVHVHVIGECMHTHVDARRGLGNSHTCGSNGLSFGWWVLTAKAFAKPVDRAGHLACLEDWGWRGKGAGTPDTNQAKQDPEAGMIVRNHF
jgi:hypothetical protein